MNKRPFQVALVVGRFQPFHKGHLYLLQQALSMADELVIAIGSVKAEDESNPLSYATRRDILEQVLEAEGLQSRVKNIVPVDDYASDDAWLEELVKRAGPFEVVVGNNDWTNQVLVAAGYKVMTIPDLRRDEYQGTVIRELVKHGQTWENRVPASIAVKVRQALMIDEKDK